MVSTEFGHALHAAQVPQGRQHQLGLMAHSNNNLQTLLQMGVHMTVHQQ